MKHIVIMLSFVFALTTAVISWNLIGNQIDRRELTQLLKSANAAATNNSFNSFGLAQIEQETLRKLEHDSGTDNFIDSATLASIALRLAALAKDQTTARKWNSIAEEKYQHAISLSPLNPRGWLGLSRAMLALDKIDSNTATVFARAMILGGQESDLEPLFGFTGMRLTHLMRKETKAEWERIILRVSKLSPDVMARILMASGVDSASAITVLQRHPTIHVPVMKRLDIILNNT